MQIHHLSLAGLREMRRWFWLLLVFHCVLAEDVTKYIIVGGTLKLRPTAAREELTSVQWKIGGNFLAEWFSGSKPRYFGSIGDRTRLDNISGEVEVSNMSPADDGIFTVELNLNIQDRRYVVKAIKGVPTPSILTHPLTCSKASPWCTLSCDGVTAGSEPITYSWMKDASEWTSSSTQYRPKYRNISRDDSNIKTFTCQMENPVSKKTSKAKDNVFYQPPNHAVWAVPVVVLVVVSATVLAIFLMRDRIKKRFFSTAAVI